MRPRHAAALALVGWYLMVPPPHSSESVPPPLSKWSVYQTFESADVCYYVRTGTATGMLQDPPPNFVEQFDGSFMNIFKHAECVATDDPRLKSK